MLTLLGLWGLKHFCYSTWPSTDISVHFFQCYSQYTWLNFLLKLIFFLVAQSWILAWQMPKKHMISLKGIFHVIIFKAGGDGLVSKSCLTLVTPWTIPFQFPLSMGFSRQEYWSGLPFPSPGDLPNPGIKPGSHALQESSLPTELQGKPFSRLLAGYYVNSEP